MEITHVSMKNFSSLHIGGEGDLVIVKNEEELLDALNYAKENNRTVHILGEGTNTYFAEDLSKYLFIKLEILGKEIGVRSKENDDSVFISANAGEKWDDIVSFSVENNLWGMENMSLIPGTVGAAPVQNIGAYGSELKDVFVSLRAYDTKQNIFVELTNAECLFGYRDSVFKHESGRYVIVSVTLKLSTEARPVLSYKPLDALVGKESLTPKDVRDLVIKTRTEKLPDYKVYPNAGSFFKNPVVDKSQAQIVKAKHPEAPLIDQGEYFKIPAAWLIEHVANMKGVRIEGIGTWPNQPLVIVNYGNATVSDIDFFVKEIKKRIYENVGVNLEQEVNIVS